MDAFVTSQLELKAKVKQRKHLTVMKKRPNEKGATDESARERDQNNGNKRKTNKSESTNQRWLTQGSISYALRSGKYLDLKNQKKEKENGLRSNQELQRQGYSHAFRRCTVEVGGFFVDRCFGCFFLFFCFHFGILHLVAHQLSPFLSPESSFILIYMHTCLH